MKISTALMQTLGLQVAQSAASIATGAIVARTLGPDGQAIYASIAAAVATGSAIAVLGQFQGIAIATARKDFDLPTLLAAAAAQALMIGVVGIAALPLIRRGAIPSESIGTAALLVFLLATDAMGQLLRALFLGQRRIRAFNTIGLVQRSGTLAGVLILVLLDRATPFSVCATWAIANTGALVAALGGKESPLRAGRPNWSAAWRGWSAAFQHGGRAFVVLTLNWVLIRSDIWMLRPLQGLGAVGQMSVAIALGEWLWYIPSIFNSILFGASAADEGVESSAKIAAATRITFGVTAALGAVLLLVGPRLMLALYGPRYAVAGVLFVALVPAMVAMAGHIVVDAYFAGRGFPAVTLWAVVVALSLKVVLYAGAIERFGLIGAAYVTGLAYTAMFGIKLLAFRRATGIRLRQVLVATPNDLSQTLARLRESLTRTTLKIGESASG